MPLFTKLQYLLFIDFFDGDGGASGLLSGQDDFSVGALAEHLAQGVVVEAGLPRARRGRTGGTCARHR